MPKQANGAASEPREQTERVVIPPVHEAVNLAALRVKVDLTPTSSHSQAMAAVETVCQAIDRQEASIEHLRLILGRVLIVIEGHKLYEPQFASFEQFSRKIEADHRLSRPTIQNAMLVARRLPNVTAAQVESIPMTSLTLVARAAKDATPEVVEELLTEAEGKPAGKFAEALRERGILAPRPAQPTVPDGMVDVRFRVSQAIAEQWKKIVGSRNPDEVFSQAVAMLAMTHAGGARQGTSGDSPVAGSPTGAQRTARKVA